MLLDAIIATPNLQLKSLSIASRLARHSPDQRSAQSAECRAQRAVGGGRWACTRRRRRHCWPGQLATQLAANWPWPAPASPASPRLNRACPQPTAHSPHGQAHHTTRSRKHHNNTATPRPQHNNNNNNNNTLPAVFTPDRHVRISGRLQRLSHNPPKNAALAPQSTPSLQPALHPLHPPQALYTPTAALVACRLSLLPMLRHHSLSPHQPMRIQFCSTGTPRFLISHCLGYVVHLVHTRATSAALRQP
jgi:hypothetical protein